MISSGERESAGVGANSKPVERRAGPFVFLLLISMVLSLRGSVTQADEIAELRAPAERGGCYGAVQAGPNVCSRPRRGAGLPRSEEVVP